MRLETQDCLNRAIYKLCFIARALKGEETHEFDQNGAAFILDDIIAQLEQIRDALKQR